jgi:hypothetical protein
MTPQREIDWRSNGKRRRRLKKEKNIGSSFDGGLARRASARRHGSPGGELRLSLRQPIVASLFNMVTIYNNQALCLHDFRFTISRLTFAILFATWERQESL